MFGLGWVCFVLFCFVFLCFVLFCFALFCFVGLADGQEPVERDALMQAPCLNVAAEGCAEAPTQPSVSPMMEHLLSPDRLGGVTF